MDKGVRDYTLLERTISRLIGGQELQIAQCGDSQPASQSIKAPSLEHLDFGGSGIEPTKQKPIRKKHGPVRGEGPPRPVEDDDFEDASGWRRKAAKIIKFLFVMALLLVVNEFYGWPLRGSRWLRPETYRTTIGDIVGSKPTAKPDYIQQQKMIDIKGIAYSSDKSSAIIGNRLVQRIFRFKRTAEPGRRKCSEAEVRIQAVYPRYSLLDDESASMLQFFCAFAFCMFGFVY